MVDSVVFFSSSIINLLNCYIWSITSKIIIFPENTLSWICSNDDVYSVDSVWLYMTNNPIYLYTYIRIYLSRMSLNWKASIENVDFKIARSSAMPIDIRSFQAMLTSTSLYRTIIWFAHHFWLWSQRIIYLFYHRHIYCRYASYFIDRWLGSTNIHFSIELPAVCT